MNSTNWPLHFPANRPGPGERSYTCVENHDGIDAKIRQGRRGSRDWWSWALASLPGCYRISFRDYLGKLIWRTKNCLWPALDLDLQLLTALQQPLLTGTRWCLGDLIGLAWFALISARTFYSYVPNWNGNLAQRIGDRCLVWELWRQLERERTFEHGIYCTL